MSNIHKKGFTLVELLVVLAVMAILAGITIVGYGAWRDSNAAKVLRSDLNSAKTAMVSARNFGTGYPTSPSFSSSSTFFKPSKDVNITYVSGNATTFCIRANSIAIPNIIYHISESDKEAQRGNC